MPLEILSSLSLPGDSTKANEDAFGHAPNAAVVFDGATGLGEQLLPGPSDAAWISTFGARRLMAHMRDGDAPDAALLHALADTEKSFLGLRRRAPKEKYEIPYAAMIFVAETDKGLQVLWFGDCGLIVKRPGAAAVLVGDGFEKRAAEAKRAAALSAQTGVSSTVGVNRPHILPALRASRNRMNGPGGWAFGPDTRAAKHASGEIVEAPPGTLLLLASDGFLALGGDYGRYDVDGLMAAIDTDGLEKLGAELRTLEESDPEGARFPRFKKSDDATALCVRVT
jgi:hypothetical protein